MTAITIYLLLFNALGFILMLADKHKAKRNLWRISEATLLGIAVLGGCLGILGGMYAFRHKTLHPKFRLGLPLILSAQITFGIWLYTIFM